MLPDGTKNITTRHKQSSLISSFWYYEIIHPFTVKPVTEPLPSNPFESKEWVPQVFDLFSNTWRKASKEECEHWDDLVNCPSCKHPTFPQFDCYVCGATLSSNLQETEKRVLFLVCIIPDETEEHYTEENVDTISEKEEEHESTELEDVIEEERSGEYIEREEDE